MARPSVVVSVELPPFQRLLDAHAGDVHRFLVASVGPLDADDCYQETWISALRAYPRLSSAENLRGWLFTIAHRKALDAHRARRRRPLPLGDALPEPAKVPVAFEFGDATGLWQAVAGLAPKQRAAVALRFIVDADYGQIAAMMGTSEDAARANVHEALKRLRREDLDVGTA
jgi:RNA polymerase sigma factor (sigma-70 family)